MRLTKENAEKTANAIIKAIAALRVAFKIVFLLVPCLGLAYETGLWISSKIV